MVATLFDTSPLVAAFVTSHEHHESARAWLLKVHFGEIQGVIATHSLAELYAILTRLPLRPRKSGTVAWGYIQLQIIPFFEVVSQTQRTTKM